MVRCAQFASIVRLALVLGALIAPTGFALAADRTSDLLQQLSQQAATGDCSPTDQLHGACVPRPNWAVVV
jgi:hypothetical protein